MLPADLLPALRRADATRPRLTCYDDTPGATCGERIELSARVLDNWVAKAANLLQEEWGLERGARVGLDLPPHWRLAYWALAAWSMGCCVDFSPGSGDPVDHLDALVTTDSGRAARAAEAGIPAAVVTLAALARRSPEPLPPGVLDESRDLATQGDLFSPDEEPEPEDIAWVDGPLSATYGAVLAGRVNGPDRLHVTDSGDPRAFLELALATWAAGGSVVLSRGPVTAEAFDRRTLEEGATRVFARP